MFSLFKINFKLSFLFFLLPFLPFLFACSKVSVVHLPLVELDSSSHQILKAEALRRLYGELDFAEREKKRGHYYVVRWLNQNVKQERKFVFEYFQKNNPQVKKFQEFVLPFLETKGVLEFKVAGEEFEFGGNILCWRLSFYINNEKKWVKESLLWERLQVP